MGLRVEYSLFFGGGPVKRFLCRTLPVIGGFTCAVLLAASASAVTVVRPIGASTDDAEEFIDTDGGSKIVGGMDITSTDIELSSDGPRDERQYVGLRFTNLGIPQGATITNAQIQFRTDETDSEPDVDILIQGELSPNSSTFTETLFNISTRPRTTNSVIWENIPLWSTVGQAGPAQQTPSLASIVQEIVNLPLWTSGNAMSFIFSPEPLTDDTDERTADAFDDTGDASRMPATLTIEFIPEPASWALAVVAGLGLAARRVRRR
jgi:hypothetical protein